mgnify:CR=1 FL=1
MQFAKSAARRVPASGQVLEEKSQSRSDEEETGDGESGEKLSAETVPGGSGAADFLLGSLSRS